MILIFGIVALVLAKVMRCSGEELISLAIVIAAFEISDNIDSLRINMNDELKHIRNLLDMMCIEIAKGRRASDEHDNGTD